MDNNTDFNNNVTQYDNIHDEYYKVNIDDLEFQILKLTSDKSTQYSILDSKGHDCVHIVIQTRRGESRTYLSQVTYRPTCKMFGLMERGLSTVKMVKALLIKVIKDTKLNKIYLKDKSEIDCILPDEETVVLKVSLGMLSFIIHGKTWYQKYFGANVLNETTSSKMEVANKLLESIVSADEGRKLLELIDDELKYYPEKMWIVDLEDNVSKIIKSNIDKSWRILLSELFSHSGTLSRKMKANIGCLLFEILNSFLIEKFNLPDLKNLNMYITRETILAYPEAHIEIEKNDAPIHTDKHRKEMLLKLSAMMNNVSSMYTVGGKHTLKAKRIKPIPRSYGRNLIGYFNRRKETNGTRKLR